MKKQLFEKIH